MLKHLAGSVLLATFPLFAAPVHAAPATISDEPVIHRDYSAQWSPGDLTLSILRECKIPNGFFRTERDYDGKVRINQSPSVTSDQSLCARRVILRQKLEVRGETAPDAGYRRDTSH